MTLLNEELLQPLMALKRAAPLGLHEPDLSGNELTYVTECITSGWVSSVGKFVDQFERNIADYTDVSKAVAVVNGTAALHLALLVTGVKANDEVLTPALTFVATTNAICYLGAIPHFVDSGVSDLSVSPEKLSTYLASIADTKSGITINKHTGRRISALIVMHALGNPANMQALKTIAKDYQLILIEDAAEAMGSSIDNQHLGTLGDIGIFSFNGNKIMTTGSGGALVSHNQDFMEKAKHLSTTAKTTNDGFFFHDQTGFNYRLANINAALGVAQMERLDEFLAHKKKLAGYYQHIYKACDAIDFLTPEFGGISNFWLCGVRLKGISATDLSCVIQQAHQQGIMLRPLWQLNNELPMYQSCPAMSLENASAHVASTLCLPSSACLGLRV
jgi:perosamine synthetase